MATRRGPHHTIAPLLEVSVHRAGDAPPVTARLELTQARELIGRLSLLDPDDAGVVAAMKGSTPSRLLLGLQSFYRLVLERDGCLALADTEGSLWTIPARAVEAVRVRLVTGVARPAGEPDPLALQRAFSAAEGRSGAH